MCVLPCAHLCNRKSWTNFPILTSLSPLFSIINQGLIPKAVSLVLILWNWKDFCKMLQQNDQSYQSQELCDMGFLKTEVRNNEQTRSPESISSEPVPSRKYRQFMAPGMGRPGGRGAASEHRSSLKAAPAPREGTWRSQLKPQTWQ